MPNLRVILLTNTTLGVARFKGMSSSRREEERVNLTRSEFTNKFDPARGIEDMAQPLLGSSSRRTSINLGNQALARKAETRERGDSIRSDRNQRRISTI